jgi:hypothetical protein
VPDLSTIRPLLSSKVAQSLADQAGGTAYGGGVESTNVAFGGPTADFILYGVVNGTFAQGPPNASDYIDPQNNPLPYWPGPTQVSGGAVQAQWVADSGSPSGYNLRFTVNPGAAGDEAYVEQIVPMSGVRTQSVANILWCDVLWVSGDGSATIILEGQYLDASLNALGSPGTRSLTTSSGVISVTLLLDGGAIPNVTYLRIRLHVLRGGADATTAVVDFTNVRNLIGEPVVAIPDDNNPSSFAPAYISQQSGTVTLWVKGTADVLTVSSAGTLTVTGALVRSRIITDTIAANKNNYAPTGLATCATLVTTVTGATRTVTGFDATGFVAGQEFTVVNDPTNQLVFTDSDVASTSGNRIGCPSAVSKTISTNGSATFVYLPSQFAAAPFRMVSFT